MNGIEFAEALIPMFVAADPLGLLPHLWALTEEKDDAFRRTVAVESFFYALGLGLVFAVAGVHVFRVLGITTDDFRVGGGIVFLVMAIRVIIGAGRAGAGTDHHDEVDTSISVVPLATPGIVGPAVIANIVLLSQTHGVLYAMAVFATIATGTAVLLYFSGTIRRLIGDKMMKAVSKVFAILMVGIAVMFIRVGIEGILRSQGA